MGVGIGIEYGGGEWYLNPGVAYEYNFAYDDAGNRTRWETVGGPTINYTYDAANKMLTAGNSTFIYDDKGNTLTETNGSTVTNYIWDYLNRMTQWQKTGQTTQDYVYNGYGLRVRITPNGGTATDFLLDRREIVEEITGQDVTAYVGPGLISSITGTAHTIYHADGIGSTRAMTNCSTPIAVSETGIYDAYGNLLQVNPSNGTPSFGYAGKYRYFADSTGLDYLKMRYYDPMSARFVSRDPIGYRGGFNVYEYVGDKPTTGIDPTGKAGFSIGPRQPGNGPVKLCFRDLGFGIRHVYFLIGGSPIGYGPNVGVGEIPGDIDDLDTGKANCKPVPLDPCQEKCMQDISDGKINVPGNWEPGSNVGIYIPGVAGTGPYNPIFHNCYDWAQGALDLCGINKNLHNPSPRIF